MKLIEILRKDRITAFKAKENIKKNLLGCLISDACKEDKEPSDEKVLSVIKKFIDNANFVIAQTKEGEYESYQAHMEIDILEAYRPTQMDSTSIMAKIHILVTQGGAKDLKTIMTWFKENCAGCYDGKLVSTLAKDFLK